VRSGRLSEPGVARTVLVIPCYNEALRLPRGAFESFAETTPDVSFLFVDDGSRDDTRALLDTMASCRPAQFSVLPLEHNLGKGEAVRRGMLAAFDVAPCCAGYWDADLSAPLAALSEFIELLASRPDLDLVLGARVRLLGHAVVRSGMRRTLGRLFAELAAVTLGLPVYDTQCGAKLFRCTPDMRALFAEPFCSDWAFDVELLARMLRRECASGALEAAPGVRAASAVAARLFELPLRDWREVQGTKLGPQHLALALRDLFRIRRRYLH